jgi:uncharacterized membrane protein
MLSLVCAALFFVGIHLVISGTAVRDEFVARLGERAYRGVFSLLSAAGLTWLIWSFLHVRVPQMTALVDWRWLAVALNLIAFVFIVFGVMSRSPTAVGGEGALHDPDPAKAAHRITRHPMLWGIALWSATHMVFNPQLPTLLFFGAFLVLSLIGPRSIDAKRAKALGSLWQSYVQKTSNVPFVAIAQGRNRLSIAELFDHRLLIALGIWAVFLMYHGKMFGLPAI